MKRRKLLVVDDDIQMRELIKLTAEPLRLKVSEAQNVQDAWKLLQEQRPQLVIVDMFLEAPHDGLELCRQIKSTPELGHAKVIVLTTASQVEDFQRGRAAGADHYIVKPFSPASLLKLLGDTAGPHCS